MDQTFNDESLISVITAVDAQRSKYLQEAFNSLLAQDVPNELNWEWCLQVDGVDASECWTPEDSRVSCRINGGRAGAAASRNLALARARGSIVMTLDADDILLPGALNIVSNQFSKDNRICWLATGHVRIDAHGSLTEPEVLRIGTRTVEAGGLNAWWQRFGHVPLIPHCIAYRADVVRSLGGWMALPRSEDTGLMMAVAQIWPGKTLDSPTLGYRHWPAQQTAEPWIDGSSYAKSAGRQLIKQRIDAMARLHT